MIVYLNNTIVVSTNCGGTLDITVILYDGEKHIINYTQEKNEDIGHIVHWANKLRNNLNMLKQQHTFNSCSSL
jgi:hypothetical protein